MTMLGQFQTFLTGIFLLGPAIMVSLAKRAFLESFEDVEPGDKRQH